jgi:hypothetical protein
MPRLPKCYMCGRKARPLTAVDRDGMVYVNAQGVALFCSKTCATNYALLWGPGDILAGNHYCPAAEKWECQPAYQCERCKKGKRS